MANIFHISSHVYFTIRANTNSFFDNQSFIHRDDIYKIIKIQIHMTQIIILRRVIITDDQCEFEF